MAFHPFTRQYLETILSEAVNKTLGEVDKNNVFERTKNNKKITGIAGDVIEQSVLGYPSDSESEPDIIVDGVNTEVKTTGIRYSKKQKGQFEAKEPLSVTAVSPKKIIYEDFETSQLWHKLAHLLFIYYLYDSKKTVSAAEYAKFPIKGYQFFEFSEEDKKIIMNDWKIVQNFIASVHDNHLDKEIEYPKISKLRKSMLYMDTAPKYPNSPRFRLKRKLVTTIVQDYFNQTTESLEKLNTVSSITDLFDILSNFSRYNKGKSIHELSKQFKIELSVNEKGEVSKQVCEILMTRAIGANSKKLRNIDVFRKADIIAKTITLTPTGGRTEDVKFDTVDFEEFTQKSITFEESSIYDAFSSQKMLFIVFQEKYRNSPLDENIFLGFKLLTFSDEFIDLHVRKTWEQVKYLIQNNKFEVTPVLDKFGNVIINKKTGTKREATNLPKSKDYLVFLRGTAQDSTKKNLVLNGYSIYQQNLWIKGKTIVEMLNSVSFI